VNSFDLGGGSEEGEEEEGDGRWPVCRRRR